ncbi:MAG: hypothetical protein ACJAT2_000737 [Bacteriovoracaceae bacterium]|jgi:hypothetical protein
MGLKRVLRYFKLALFVFILLESTTSFSKEKRWLLSDSEEGTFLINGDLSSPAKRLSGQIKVIQVKKLNSQIDLVIYQAGSAGTFHPIIINYAAIYNKEKRKVLGHFPYSIISEDKDYNPIQPKWKFSEGLISIEDPSFDIKQDIRY